VAALSEDLARLVPAAVTKLAVEEEQDMRCAAGGGEDPGGCVVGGGKRGPAGAPVEWAEWVVADEVWVM